MNALSQLTVAPLADVEIDVSEAYAEVHDPDNALGLEVIAFFETQDAEFSKGNSPDAWGLVDAHTLIGLTIDDGHGAQVYTRDQVVDLLGIDWIWRQESLADDQAMEEAA